MTARISLLRSSIVAVAASVSFAHAQSGSEQQGLMEALALHGAIYSKETGLTRTELCAALADETNLKLKNLWKLLCQDKPQLTSIRSCLAGYFECLRKEGMPKKLPAGASLNCEKRANSCERPSR
jgi:hypothetical protein